MQFPGEKDKIEFDTIFKSSEQLKTNQEDLLENYQLLIFILVEQFSIDLERYF